MKTEMTLAEMTKRLEEYRTLPWTITKSDRVWILDLALAELARREREYEASPCFLCGWRPKFHPREGHEFTPWPATKEPEPDCLVTDGEAG